MLEAAVERIGQAQGGEEVFAHAAQAIGRDDAELWASFGAAATANTFCRAWLAIQSRSVAGTRTALLLLKEESGRYVTAATWPDDRRDLAYLAPTAQRALIEHKGLVDEPNAAESQDGYTLAYPIDVGGELKGVAVLDVGPRDPHELVTLRRQVHWGVGWLETLFRRQQVEEASDRSTRTAFALEVLAGSEHKPLQAAAIEVANAMAVKMKCRRASLGLARRGAVRLAAISHSAVFEERNHVVATIENAMEEALDQRRAVSWPETPSTMRAIAIAHQDLARESGASSVASVPMRSASRIVGVLTLERDRGEPFCEREIGMLEAAALVLGPLFEMKVDANRLIAGRAASGAGALARALLGPRRPAAKLAALALLGAGAALALAPAPYRITAKAAVEGAVQRAVVAPFDGYVASAPARAGDIVAKGQVLATLDDQDLRLDALRWRSQVGQDKAKVDEAMGKHDRAAMRIADAGLGASQAQLTLAEDKLARTTLTAAFAGLVVSGDLSQSIGAPLEKGKVIYQLAPLESFRVMLDADERDVARLAPGQRGTVVLAALPGAGYPFTLTAITPVATSAEGRTTFRVEASVENIDGRLRPGMEGVGKVDLGRQPLLKTWGQPMLDWARLTIWSWRP